ncbi:hypothetical protein D3C78_1103010 [compost metagenome]
MLTQHRLPAAYQTKRIFHVCAQRQHWRNIRKPIRQRYRIRHVAPRTAQHRAFGVHNGIIHSLQNVAVVQQKSVSESPQVIQRLLVGHRRGFTAAVSGRHHQRTGHLIHQQML